ncbi:hypothetical protein [Paraburkholderia ribeironis]|uniref:hypothetical protein n=1 Tax=Paraburkholderia ribeironis TaxID=1247936 RepID=UPI000B9D52EE|nr:hypothetical protein [Paraburkholderia ribeironis]
MKRNGGVMLRCCPASATFATIAVGARTPSDLLLVALATEPQRTHCGDTLHIADEPTTGLHSAGRDFSLENQSSRVVEAVHE